MPLAHRRNDAYDVVRAAVLSMPAVVSKRMFGAEAFFTASRMFAFLFEEAIVLKLPESERQDMLDSRVARPFLTPDRSAFGRWVEIPTAGSEAASRAIRLAASAHALARSPLQDGPRKRRRRLSRKPAAEE